MLGGGLMSFTTYSFMFWSAPFLLRSHGVSASEAGFYLMIASVLGGGGGVILGGWLSDRLKQRAAAGRLQLVVVSLLLVIPTALGFLFAPSAPLAYALAVAFNVASTLWVGSANAAITELVLPRMRAISTAVLLSCTPSSVSARALHGGSDQRCDGCGRTPRGGRAALRSGARAAVAVPSLLVLLRALRHIADDEASVQARALRAGEK